MKSQVRMCHQRYTSLSTLRLLRYFFGSTIGLAVLLVAFPSEGLCLKI